MFVKSKCGIKLDLELFSKNRAVQRAVTSADIYFSLQGKGPFYCPYSFVFCWGGSFKNVHLYFCTKADSSVHQSLLCDCTIFLKKKRGDFSWPYWKYCLTLGTDLEISICELWQQITNEIITSSAHAAFIRQNIWRVTQTKLLRQQAANVNETDRPGDLRTNKKFPLTSPTMPFHVPLIFLPCFPLVTR